MIYLYTDFGSSDIYLGQLKAVLQRQAPGVPLVDLCHDLPSYDVLHAAHLLAAMAGRLDEPKAVLLAVVDPGVGSERRPLVVQADGLWLVGPDNGLLAVTVARARQVRCWEIVWRPATLSRSFHGRDLFAPMAAMLATDSLPPGALRVMDALQPCAVMGELAEIVYVDHYGNALSGLRAASVPTQCVLEVAGQRLPNAGTFADVRPGSAFWYENSLGLVEIAVNQGNAARQLGLEPGTPLRVAR